MKIRYLLLGMMFLLFFTRFVNLGWGLPYPLHPDERNMADAIMKLSCTQFDLNCFNPHFFAYGQLPLYLSYALVSLYHLVLGRLSDPVSYFEAVFALRIFSAFASVGTVFYLVKTAFVLFPQWKKRPFLLLPFFIFSPGLIQYAHFGTTESLLMLFYTILTYLSVRLITHSLSPLRFTVFSGLVWGIALGTKVSALVFGGVPLLTIVLFFHLQKKRDLRLLFRTLLLLLVLAGFVFVISSPYNLLAWKEFQGSMKYESEVGLGALSVFYTRQFDKTLPFIFQMLAVFPYALGIPVLVCAVLSFFLLPKTPGLFVLRMATVIFIMSQMALYTKWTRFMAPVFPLMILLAVGMYTIKIRFRRKKWIQWGIIGFAGVSLLPGIAFLSIYLNSDVRYQASHWIYTNVRPSSLILSETANVIDLPLPDPSWDIRVPSYHTISFNSYDLDTEVELQRQFENYVSVADYIFVPSRRVFMNHTCLRPETSMNLTEFAIHSDGYCEYLETKYPRLNQFYQQLFSGKLGFELVATFTSFPKIELGGVTFFEFPDEQMEETGTVFDHPVVRIYKRVK
ncbi:hypothetical protein HGA88_01515 [Candidatus Roizmanbacteria bacterium]|nr:hypothetical protein [Candidatus Roizmanbacteria bacterium]